MHEHICLKKAGHLLASARVAPSVSGQLNTSMFIIPGMVVQGHTK